MQTVTHILTVMRVHKHLAEIIGGQFSLGIQICYFFKFQNKGSKQALMVHLAIFTIKQDKQKL